MVNGCASSWPLDIFCQLLDSFVFHTFLFFAGMKIEVGCADLFLLGGAGLGLGGFLVSAAALSPAVELPCCAGLCVFGGDGACRGGERMTGFAVERGADDGGDTGAATLPFASARSRSSFLACAAGSSRTFLTALSSLLSALGPFLLTKIFGAGGDLLLTPPCCGLITGGGGA